MMTKPLLLLAALTVCCCISSLHALGNSCRCLRTVSTPIPVRVIKKIEVYPISGSCRRPEVIVSRRNGSRVCVNPNVKWIITLQSRKLKSNSTLSSMSSTTTTV